MQKAYGLLSRLLERLDWTKLLTNRFGCVLFYATTIAYVNALMPFRWFRTSADTPCVAFILPRPFMGYMFTIPECFWLRNLTTEEPHNLICRVFILVLRTCHVCPPVHMLFYRMLVLGHALQPYKLFNDLARKGKVHVGFYIVPSELFSVKTGAASVCSIEDVELFVELLPTRGVTHWNFSLMNFQPCHAFAKPFVESVRRKAKVCPPGAIMIDCTVDLVRRLHGRRPPGPGPHRYTAST